MGYSFFLGGGRGRGMHETLTKWGNLRKEFSCMHNSIVKLCMQRYRTIVLR